LFTDPFASVVAGNAAVRQALLLARPWSQPAGPAAAASSNAAEGAALRQSPQPPLQRRFCFSNVAARVWWFDQQLMAALAAPAQAQGRSPPRQVVVLGAGFDSRPWRMALPAGVTWFEVDQTEVVEAKREQFTQLGAGFHASDAPGRQQPMYPLRAASWASLAADLGQPGWSATLRERGLDSSQPIAWMLEGLLMYLTPEQVAALLAEMAGEAAAGGCGLGGPAGRGAAPDRWQRKQHSNL
jgi:O-methyltransferase involved in polyketide biosynthesis